MALVKATESGDTDLVYLTLFHIWQKNPPLEFFGKIQARPLPRDLFMKYSRCYKHEFLKDFYLSTGQLHEVAFLLWRESWELGKNPMASKGSPLHGPRIKLIEKAQNLFAETKEHVFESKAAEEHAKLLKMQHEFEVSTKQPIFVGSSISDTIRTCIVLGNHKLAMKVKHDFKVSEKQWYWLKVLLKGISGAFRPGVLTALMGVSGAGKTTLMDVLAGRKTGGYIEGTITISGYPKQQDTFARISGYCEQTDIHSPNVTVYESLVYSSWLRLPPEVDSETRKMFVEEVMELVDLKSLRGALVGLPGVSGLSTEQRKRLTVVVELVANPSIIFMDEPTSGLDARAAAIVMRTVRNTVNTGRTVVCTIHQPSIDIFEAFDELFLMKEGGEEMYVGPLGHNSCHLIKYFEGIDGVPKIKHKYNPATWMLEVTTAAQEEKSSINFVEIYKNSDLFQRNNTLIKSLSTHPVDSSDLHFQTQYSQSVLNQCLACLWKHHLSYWRHPAYTAVRIFFTICVALVFGSIFWKQGTNTQVLSSA